MEDTTMAVHCAKALAVCLLAALTLVASAAPEAGARRASGPRLVSAVTLDVDGDGRVDRVVLRFSHRIRGKPRRRAFLVRGRRVTAVGRPRGRALRLRVAERRGCDVGGSPVVRYRGPGLRDRRRRRVRRSRVNMERRDRRAPRLVCVVTGDGDGDGRLDHLVLTYSKRVRNRRSWGRRMPFRVDGYRLRSVERARGRTLKLRLAERWRADTGARPAVTYRRTRGRRARPYAVRGRGGQAFSGTFKATRDRVAPLVLTGRTVDMNADGLLDGVVVGYSEAVVAKASAFSVVGARVSGAATLAPGAVLLGLGPGRLDTGARPVVTQRGDGSGVADLAGNPAPGRALPAADGAAPVLLSARTGDVRGSRGRIDTMQVAFSEPVSHPADADGSYPLAVGGYALAGVAEAAGRGVTLALREGTGPDSGARPAISYVRGRGAPVRDGAGNEVAERVLGTSFDGAAPALVGATTLDADGNGRLDAVRFEFSEPVLHAAESGPGSFSALGVVGRAALAAQGSTVDLALVEAASPNTGVRPGVAYSPDGVGDVTDPAGNRAGASTLAATADGARPVVVSAATADAGPADNRIDRVQLRLSEPVAHARDSAAPFSFETSGYTVTAVGASSGNELALELRQAEEPDTGSAPEVHYTGAGTPLRDASGQESPLRSYPGLTRDAVAPALVSAATDDGDADGSLDAVVARYSEAVNGSAAAPYPFAVSGRSLDAIQYGGARVRLSFEERAPDTDARPDVSYAPGDVRDFAEGAGDAADAAAGFSLTAQDGAGPALVAARTVDADADGTIDGVRTSFSEPLSYADSSPPLPLRVAERTVRSVSGPQGARGDDLRVSVAEAPAPDGGYRPAVTVVSPASAAKRLRDRADPANDARELTFAATADGVRPRLVGAQMGEASDGSCRAAPAGDGRLDCVRARWSEPVAQPGDAKSPFAFTLDNGYSLAPEGLPASPAAEALDVPLQPKPAPDRDRAAALTYASGSDAPVADPAGNAAMDASVAAERACADTLHDGSDAADNDTRATATPDLPLLAPALERRCAFDDDWFRVRTGAAGIAKAVARPGPGLDVELRLYDSAGTVVAEATAGPPGALEALRASGLAPDSDYWLRVSAPEPQEGPYCLSASQTAEDPSCGPRAGELIFTEAGLDGSASAKFLEVKNVSDFPLDAASVPLRLELGTASCELTAPAGSEAVIDPGEYVIITDDAGSGPFKCDAVGSLASTGERLRLMAGGEIDRVDLSGLLVSPLASGHSLELKPSAEDAAGNDQVERNWCRTWLADTRGSAGDGCDEYRLNEVLFDPVASGADGMEGRSFVELAGNLPARPRSEAASWLLGGFILRGLSGETGEGTGDFTLAPTASPHDDGTYVVADAVDADPGRSNVPAPDRDELRVHLDLGDPAWPGLTAPDPGPRGLQLLHPGAPASRPCSALADALGWRQTDEGFREPADQLRACAVFEGEPVAPIVVRGRSAARDNLSSTSDTSYEPANDSGQNATDFCRQTVPNPGALNVRPGC